MKIERSTAKSGTTGPAEASGSQEASSGAARFERCKPIDQLVNAAPTRARLAATEPPLMSTIRDIEIGDGRGEKALAWRLERHADFVATYVTPEPELRAQVEDYLARLRPANLPPETDYRGKRLAMGPDVTLTDEAGAVEILVPARLVPAGRSVAELDLSADGRFVAFSTAGTGDDRVWSVIDRKSHELVLPQIVFNSFGNGLRFAADSRGVYYPNSKPAGFKVRPEVMFQSLDHVGTGAPQAKPVMVFKGASSLPHFIYPLTADDVLVAANLTIDQTPGFPLFNTLLSRSAEGVFSDDAGTLLPSGDIGRIVSAEADAVIYQTPGVHDTYALTKVDPKTGQPTEIVPSLPDATLHVAQRVGDKLCTWYLSTDQRWSLRIFDLEGRELKTVSMRELGMPDWCEPSLKFTGDASSERFTDFTVSSKLKSRRTYRLNLETLAVEGRFSGKEVDLDPKKFKEEHGFFTARDGTKIPYHLWTPLDVPAGQQKRVVAESYGSIGIVLNRGWDLTHHLHLALGFSVMEVGARGGGEHGAKWRNLGARDRTLTIDDQSDAGYFLRDRGFDVRVGYGRSWGGWKEENGAARDPEAFTHRISVVSAGNSQRLVVQNPEIWSAGDFGAGMDPNGQWDDQDVAFEQARRLSSPQRLAEAPKLPTMLFCVQNQDDRAEPGSPQLSMNILERRFGQRNRKFAMVSVDGGHGARAHRPLLPHWFRGQFGSEIVLRPQLRG